MMLMIAVFLVEVFFAFLPQFVGQLTTMVAKLVLTVSDTELNTRSEIKDLKAEQAGLSVTDDFARYARLQRKVDNLMNAVKEKGGERKQRIAYLRLGITVGIYVLHAVIMLTLMFFLRNDPLMSLPASWVSPFGKMVAFPTGQPGAVGLGCWVLVSNSVIYRVKTLLGH